MIFVIKKSMPVINSTPRYISFIALLINIIIYGFIKSPLQPTHKYIVNMSASEYDESTSGSASEDLLSPPSKKRKNVRVWVDGWLVRLPW